MNYKQAQEIRSLVDTLLRVLIVVGVIALIISGMLHIGRIEQSRQELIKTEGQESQHIVLAVSNIF